MTVLRVDNRLVHGQIIEAWLPYTGAECLIIINDALVHDALRQQIMSLAVPQRVQIFFISLVEFPTVLQRYASQRIFCLLESLQDLSVVMALYAVQSVTQPLPELVLNIGNVSHGVGRKNLSPSISVTDEEWRLLEELAQSYTLDFRSIPSEKHKDLHELLG